MKRIEVYVYTYMLTYGCLNTRSTSKENENHIFISKNLIDFWI